jgi:hypothetical protein
MKQFFLKQLSQAEKRQSFILKEEENDKSSESL